MIIERINKLKTKLNWLIKKLIKCIEEISVSKLYSIFLLFFSLLHLWPFSSVKLVPLIIITIIIMLNDLIYAIYTLKKINGSSNLSDIYCIYLYKLKYIQSTQLLFYVFLFYWCIFIFLFIKIIAFIFYSLNSSFLFEDALDKLNAFLLLCLSTNYEASSIYHLLSILFILRFTIHFSSYPQVHYLILNVSMQIYILSNYYNIKIT